MSKRDSTVEDLVSGILLSDNRIGSAIIEVQGANGIITLRGTIDSVDSKLAAEELVRQQEGVVVVINKLRVPGF
jgi:osmotically-inducible protein OsmY